MIGCERSECEKELTSHRQMPKLRGSRSSQSGVTPAQVAELVDALASGASGGNSVEVRVLSWAPIVNEARSDAGFRLYGIQQSTFGTKTPSLDRLGACFADDLTLADQWP